MQLQGIHLSTILHWIGGNVVPWPPRDMKLCRLESRKADSRCKGITFSSQELSQTPQKFQPMLLHPRCVSWSTISWKTFPVVANITTIFIASLEEINGFFILLPSRFRPLLDAIFFLLFSFCQFQCHDRKGKIRPLISCFFFPLFLLFFWCHFSDFLVRHFLPTVPHREASSWMPCQKDRSTRSDKPTPSSKLPDAWTKFVYGRNPDSRAHACASGCTKNRRTLRESRPQWLSQGALSFHPSWEV